MYLCYHMVWTLPNGEPICCKIKYIFAHSMTPPANAACKAPVHVHQQFLSRLWLSVDSGTLQDAEPADL